MLIKTFQKVNLTCDLPPSHEVHWLEGRTDMSEAKSLAIHFN